VKSFFGEFSSGVYMP